MAVRRDPGTTRNCALHSQAQVAILVIDYIRKTIGRLSNTGCCCCTNNQSFRAISRCSWVWRARQTGLWCPCSQDRSRVAKLPITHIMSTCRVRRLLGFSHSLIAYSKYRTTRYIKRFICRAIELVAYRKAKNLLRNYTKETILDCESYLTCITRLMNQGGWHGGRRPKFLLSCLDRASRGVPEVLPVKLGSDKGSVRVISRQNPSDFS